MLMLRRLLFCVLSGCFFISFFALAEQNGRTLVNADDVEFSKQLAKNKKSKDLLGIYPIDLSQLDISKAKTFKLPNGIEVLVFENRFAPMIYFSVCVMAGSMDDPMGKSGLAHYLEHLMFRGTKKYPKEALISSLLGNSTIINAYTSFDRTVYWEYGPKENLELFADIESDRLKEISVPESQALTERNVVTEEVRMYERNDNEVLTNYLLNALGVCSPVSRPIGGWVPEVKNLTLEDAMNFKRKHYTTDNVKILVIGDVEFDKVVEVIKKYFSHIPHSSSHKAEFDKENARHICDMTTIKITKVSKQAGVPFSWLVWRPDVCINADIKKLLAVNLFLNALADGDTSYLHQLFVEKLKIATSISLSSELDTRHPLFSAFNLFPAAGTKLVQLEKKVIDAIKKKCKTGLTLGEHYMAKNRAFISIIYALQNCKGTGGYFEGFLGAQNPLGVAIDFPTILASITRDYVNQVVKEFFLTDPVAIVNVLPVGWDESKVSGRSKK